MLFIRIFCDKNPDRSRHLFSVAFCFLPLGEISDSDVEIAGGNDVPYISGNPGLFITWIKPGSEADKLLSTGCQITKVSFFLGNKPLNVLTCFTLTPIEVRRCK